MSLADDVATWIADDPSPTDAAELRALLDSGSTDELADRFAGPLAFGTAGLRGPLRAGPAGMNAAVVIRAAAGIGAWLRTRGLTGARVVIGYDARHRSHEFALDSARVLAAAGHDVAVFDRALPTPVLAFAVRDRDAAVGIMVTASHNPANDNGYKVYLGGDVRLHASPDDAVRGDGAQIVPPVDAEIEAAIRAVGPANAVPLDEGFGELGDDVVARYVAAVVAAVSSITDVDGSPPQPTSITDADGSHPQPTSITDVDGSNPQLADITDAAAGGGQRRAGDVRIVHTAMHGVGWPVVERVFHAAGFTDLTPTLEQAAPDPDFPTVTFPNPEEPGALDLAVATATAAHADLVVASDPDADRCALAVPAAGGGFRPLTGDDVGVLLADALLRRGIRGTYATTIVSSTMLRSLVADVPGARYAETLTGFKWIVRAATDLVYGYEEALGYAVAPGVVRDKDGISAGLLAARLTRDLLAAGSSPAARLDELAAEHGLFRTRGVSVRVDDLAWIGAMTAALRADPPTSLAGRAVAFEDLLPRTDGVRLTWPDGRVVVRPSGTEPKLKLYLEVRRPVDAAGPGGAGPGDGAVGTGAAVDEARRAADADLDALTTALTELLAP